MGTFSLIFVLVASYIPLMAIAASDGQQQQQIKLEDIERDNLNSAKQQRLQQQQQQDLQQQQLLAYQQQQQLAAYQQPQQQQLSLTPSTLQQIAAAYQQPQPQQQQLYLPQLQQQQQQLLLQSYLAGAAPQFSQYSGFPSGIYTGSQLSAALQGAPASNSIQGSSANAVPVSAYFNHQQVAPQQQIIAIPAAAFQQAIAAPSLQPANYLQSAAALQQFVQTPTVNIPAQKQYQTPSITYTQQQPSAAVTSQQGAAESAYSNQLKQQQLDAYNAQLKQQQQQLYQQAQNEYNALLQQQQKNAYAAGVKSTAAPPTKSSQSATTANSGGFVPIQSPSVAHPNRGVSFTHYRRGRGGI